MKSRTLVALAALALVVTAVATLEGCRPAPPVRSTAGNPSSLFRSPALSAEPRAVAARTRVGNPYDPVVLTSAGSMAATERAFPIIAKDRWSDGRRFIRFDLPSALQLQAGDYFAITLPGSPHPMPLVVEDVARFEDVQRLSGKFAATDAAQNEFSLALSASDDYAVGHFNLGDQTLLLEAKRGVGWMTTSATEGRHLMDAESHASAERR